MKLKTGVDPTRRISSKTPAVPRSTAWAPLSASAGPSGLTSTRRHRSPSTPRPTRRSIPRSSRKNSKWTCASVNQRTLLDDGRARGRRRRRTATFTVSSMRWGGDMTGAEMVAQFAERLFAVLIRRNTSLDLQGGQTGVSPARAQRPSLGPAGIHQGGRSGPDPRQPQRVGRQAEEPAGRLEVRNQGADRGPGAGHGSRRRLGSHHSRRPALHLPGLRLRRGHKRQLCAVTRSGAVKRVGSRPRGRCEHITV